MEIRALTHEDVPAAMELSRGAGWNQVPADWHRLLDLAPEGCFAGWIDGELVATSTLVTYDGRIGWIGMVLVDPDHRRQGYGSRLFERARQLAHEQGVLAGLDATDAGRAVYGPAGFVDACPIERWCGVIEPDKTAEGPVRTLDPEEISAVQALDRRACGLDRGDLLEHLLSAEEVTGLVLGEDSRPATGADDLRGYAAVRPGREHTHVGPVVAPTAEDTTVLLEAAAEVAEESVIVDVLATEWPESFLEGLGLERQRELTRMVDGESEGTNEGANPLVGNWIVAATGFEFG